LRRAGFYHKGRSARTLRRCRLPAPRRRRGGQVLPHEPQFDGSCWSETHRPEQHVWFKSVPIASLNVWQQVTSLPEPQICLLAQQRHWFPEPTTSLPPSETWPGAQHA
jgi:hypothetical protein